MISSCTFAFSRLISSTCMHSLVHMYVPWFSSFSLFVFFAQRMWSSGQLTKCHFAGSVIISPSLPYFSMNKSKQSVFDEGLKMFVRGRIKGANIASDGWLCCVCCIAVILVGLIDGLFFTVNLVEGTNQLFNVGNGTNVSSLNKLFV